MSSASIHSSLPESLRIILLCMRSEGFQRRRSRTRTPRAPSEADKTNAGAVQTTFTQIPQIPQTPQTSQTPNPLAICEDSPGQHIPVIQTRSSRCLRHRISRRQASIQSTERETNRWLWRKNWQPVQGPRYQTGSRLQIIEFIMTFSCNQPGRPFLRFREST